MILLHNVIGMARRGVRRKDQTASSASSISALFGFFILEAAGIIERLTGKGRFFSVWITVRDAGGRIEQVQKSVAVWMILDNLKNPKGIFAGEEYREWEIVNIRIAIWEI